MAATRLFGLSFPLLRAARRIDRIELRIERSRARGRCLLDRADGTKGANRRAEESNAGEKEEGFLLGRSRHADRVRDPHDLAVIELLRDESKCDRGCEPAEAFVGPATINE